MTTITFLAPGLHSNRGGERVIHHYAYSLAQMGFKVNLMIPEGSCDINEDSSINIIEYKPIFSRFFSHHLGYIDAFPRISALYPPDTDIFIATYIPQAILAILLKFSNKKCKFILFNQDFVEMFKWRPDRFVFFCIYPRFFHKIISISEFCRTQILRYANSDSIVIKNGLDEEFHAESIKNKNVKRDGIFWLGTNNKHKGYNNFIEAMKLVKKVYPDLKIRVLGDGIQSNDMIQAVGTGGSFLSVREFYTTSDVFICSSLKEGFGLPALEAMACGCPVVTTDTGGCHEYAVDKINAFIVPPNQPRLLADKVIEILKSPTLRRRFSDAGLITASTFQWGTSDKLFAAAILDTIAQSGQMEKAL